MKQPATDEVVTTTTLLKRLLAVKLMHLRRAKGLSQKEAGDMVGLGQPGIAKYETASTQPPEGRLKLLLRAYDATDELDFYLDLLAKATGPRKSVEIPKDLRLADKLHIFLDLERGAETVRGFSTTIIGGLFQCPEYSDALHRHQSPYATDQEIRSWTDLRMSRQQILDGTESAPEVVGILDEAVLHRKVGGDLAISAQLDYLVSLAQQPRVSIRVVPFEAGAHVGLYGPFVLMGFPLDPEGVASVVYKEGPLVGQIIDEEDGLARYSAIADDLLEVALPEGDSISLIKKIRGRYV